MIAGVLWRTLFHPTYGVINAVLGLVGIPPQEWLGSPSQALPAVITVEIWQNLPVVAFVLAAGIQSLPVDLYKAAHVDGASQWQIFTRITLPLLRPVILVLLLLRIMDAFKVFDIVFTMTYGGPGRRPNSSLDADLQDGSALLPDRPGERDVVGVPGRDLSSRFTSSASCSARVRAARR